MYFEDKCIGCGRCLEVCPSGAIGATEHMKLTGRSNELILGNAEKIFQLADEGRLDAQQLSLPVTAMRLPPLGAYVRSPLIRVLPQTPDSSTMDSARLGSTLDYVAAARHMNPYSLGHRLVDR